MSEYDKELADVPLENIVRSLREIFPAWSEKRREAFAKFICASSNRQKINIVEMMIEIAIEQNR